MEDDRHGEGAGDQDSANEASPFLNIECTPSALAEGYSLNRQNIYYWMRKHGLGHKSEEDNRWRLSPSEQKHILEFDRHRPSGKRHGTNPRSRK